MKHLFVATVLAGSLCAAPSAYAQERLPEYLQAEKFTKSKLDHMLFSTTVDPHWFQKGDSFWFTYKTSEGTFWYVVNPSARSKELLFDRELLASELTAIMHDPFEARQLPIRNFRKTRSRKKERSPARRKRRYIISRMITRLAS